MTITRWAALAAVPALLAAGLCCGAAASAQATTYPNPTCLDTTVPLYSPAMWDAADGTPPEANIGIANWGANTQNGGAGGPGTAKNTADASQISTAEAHGTEILGYIATNYGTGATGYTKSSIETQMRQWHTWYGVTTFFLDEAPSATTYQSFYSAVQTWAQANISSSAADWLNMGVYPAASSWMSDGAVIMDWESSSAPTTPPSWVSSYPASRFAMVMNNVAASGIAAAVSDIEGAHAQAGFVTSDASYQTLPSWSYWTTFADDAAGSACS